MNEQRPGDLPFKRRAFFEDDRLVGARWWHEGMAAFADPQTRRHALRNIGLLIGGAAGIGILFAIFDRDDDGGPRDPAILRDALELQKEKGWDVGKPGASLAFSDASAVDSAGATDWADKLPKLAELLAPAQARLRPFYVPTLFQAPAAPSATGLRSALRPVHDASMDEAYARGEALAALFTGAEAPKGAAVLVDAPGPIAVSVAAGMAARFDPVFLFDNWPHPAGVVPSQQTLGAALYWQPRFQAAAAGRAGDAMPVFVGDDARLAPYSDAGDKFDNRYLLRVPSAASLKGLGIERLLLVRPHGGQVELDDLNDDFVALHKGGVDVKIVALDDFVESQGDAGVAGVARSSSTSSSTSAPSHSHSYYWGGSPIYHTYFWPVYGWGSPVFTRTVPVSPPPALAPRIGGGATYTPAPRPTMFSNRTIGGVAGVGRTRPTGFGVVSVRGGEVVGRSGSWGRSGSSGG